MFVSKSPIGNMSTLFAISGPQNKVAVELIRLSVLLLNTLNLLDIFFNISVEKVNSSVI